jgi:hypothetical protein
VRVTLASFFVSHLTPFGSAAGTVVNVSTLEADGVAAARTSEGIGLTGLVSAAALIALFGVGLVATAGRHIARGYLITAGMRVPSEDPDEIDLGYGWNVSPSANARHPVAAQAADPARPLSSSSAPPPRPCDMHAAAKRPK